MKEEVKQVEEAYTDEHQSGVLEKFIFKSQEFQLINHLVDNNEMTFIFLVSIKLLEI